MTKQEKLNVLETAIKKGLPRLMQPTEGCRILEKEYDEIYKIHKINKSNFVLYSEDGIGHKLVNKILEPYYEILGHDILLNDLLDWLNTEGMINFVCDKISYTGYNGFVSLTQDGYLSISYYSHEYEISLSSRIGKWDLSKQRLADQSEEFIHGLHRFLTT